MQECESKNLAFIRAAAAGAPWGRQESSGQLKVERRNPTCARERGVLAGWENVESQTPIPGRERGMLSGWEIVDTHTTTPTPTWGSCDDKGPVSSLRGVGRRGVVGSQRGVGRRGVVGCKLGPAGPTVTCFSEALYSCSYS